VEGAVVSIELRGKKGEHFLSAGKKASTKNVSDLSREKEEVRKQKKIHSWKGQAVFSGPFSPSFPAAATSFIKLCSPGRKKKMQKKPLSPLSIEQRRKGQISSQTVFFAPDSIWSGKTPAERGRGTENPFPLRLFGLFLPFLFTQQSKINGLKAFIRQKSRLSFSSRYLKALFCRPQASPASSIFYSACVLSFFSKEISFPSSNTLHLSKESE